MKNQLKINTVQDASKKSIRMIRTSTTSLYNKFPKLFIGFFILALAGGGFLYFKKNETKNETHIVARGSLEEAVSVTGKIKASTDADLSFEKGGTVSAVYVKEGQKVVAGQTIAVLSGGTDYGQVLSARAQIQSAQAQLDLLRAGTRSEEVSLKKIGFQNATQDLNNSYNTVDDIVRSSYNTVNQAIRIKTQNFFVGSVTSGIRVVTTTCNSELESKAAHQRERIEVTINNWNKQLQNTNTKGDSEEKLEIAIKNINEAIDLLDTMNTIVTAPCALTDTTLEPYRIAIASSLDSVTSANGTLVQKKNQIASLKVAIARAEGDTVLTSAPTEPERIRVQEAALRGAYAQLYQAQAASSKNVVTSPGTGIITKVEIATGEYASPGKTIARLVGTGEFSVEADVTESDIARIVLDNKVKVTVPAIDAKEVFTGKVVSIDPAEQSSEGNPLYRIVMSLDSQDPRIKSGMTAETTIVTSIIENILRIPTRYLTKIKGLSKVQVVIDDKTLATEEREIKTGRKSTDGLVEVVSGLEEGEIISLPVAPKK